MSEVMKSGVYFKSEEHSKDAKKIINRMGFRYLEENVEYGVYAYLVSATGKGSVFCECIDPVGNINFSRWEEYMRDYATTEIALIEFGFQLYNGNTGGYAFAKTIYGMDRENLKVIRSALNLYLGWDTY
ncbi:hypothetical protein B1B04_10390 [Lysinibacillus sp. KCTC 33748]|uniref:hypothetical protein n=1 Tax=unclassified Lysinibacillus TaxID=2636778 RepID=UPI0009A5C165|nr:MULTISPECIES: hypothetical protein [unclassified Lysinibacillus]OXS74013.1 hypothetical protein B1B04_10390 [Lysinibacillus sp. KCTC 33748]SKB69193.1 hypothetical protein SAMN06295926_10635 [Lysinibacillus sp. AC-3]